MTNYLDIAAFTFSAGVGWYAARFLWELLDGFIFNGDDDGS